MFSYNKFEIKSFVIIYIKYIVYIREYMKCLNYKEEL